jgi:hypothetical protein
MLLIYKYTFNFIDYSQNDIEMVLWLVPLQSMSHMLKLQTDMNDEWKGLRSHPPFLSI